jgi:hypothetical protein
MCKNLLPVPGDFGVWYCGGGVRIDKSLARQGGDTRWRLQEKLKREAIPFLMCP